MDDIKLLGLQRAEFQRAKAMDSLSNKTQLAIILFSIISIFADTPTWLYLIAVVNLILGVLWLLCVYQTKKSHSTAERARRAVLFKNGLGISLSGKAYSDLKMSFKVSNEEGAKYEDKDYFKSSEKFGAKKLAEIVEESAFWSKHLFKLSAIRYWIYFGLAVFISLLGLLLIPLLNIGNLNLFIPQVFCLVLTWLVTGNLFLTALSFAKATEVCDSIESRLENMGANGEPPEDILIIVSDYNALVETSPILPSNLYKKHRDRLNKLWVDRGNREHSESAA
jgi:hypothetical protein